MASRIANAYIDFSKMTTLVVGVRCELASGEEVVGYGFNSNGRYSAKALVDERFGPRLVEAAAEPAALADEHHNGLLCPFKCWDAMMANDVGCIRSGTTC